MNRHDDDGDDGNNSSCDSDNSILSYPDNRSQWDDTLNEFSLSSELASALDNNMSAAWTEQEKHFQYRTKILHRIASKFPNDPSIYQFLWDRELQVRSMERKSILLQQALLSSEIDVQNKSCHGVGKGEVKATTSKETTQQSNSDSNWDWDDYDWRELPDHVQQAAVDLGYCQETWNKNGIPPLCRLDWHELSPIHQRCAITLGYDKIKWDEDIYNNDGSDDNDNTVDDDIFFYDAIDGKHNSTYLSYLSSWIPALSWSDYTNFEWKMSLHTFFNLFLFIWASLSIEEMFGVLKEIFIPHNWHKPEEMKDVTMGCILFHFIYTLFGFGLMRFSTTLYSYASPAIYDCVKFDLHNGSNLGDFIPKTLSLIQKDLFVSTMLFMLSYVVINDGLNFFNHIFSYICFGDQMGSASIFLYDVVVIGLSLKLLQERKFTL